MDAAFVKVWGGNEGDVDVLTVAVETDYDRGGVRTVAP